MKQTNDTRELCDSLTRQLIPLKWRKYKFSPHFTAAQWIADFSLRIQQLNTMKLNDMEHQVSLTLSKSNTITIRLGCLAWRSIPA